MSIQSKCCGADIVTKHEKEYPLGGTTYGILTSFPICSKCGDEWPEIVKTCNCCGEPTNWLLTVNEDDYCQPCALEIKRIS